MKNRKKHIVLLFILAIIALVSAIAVLRNQKTNASPSKHLNSTKASGGMFDLLEKSAKRAKGAEKTKKEKASQHIEEADRAYENSIRELADVLFSEFGVAGLTAEATEGIKSRLVEAELKYRENHQGVREANIVRLINDLADKLGAPDYARTSPEQVRVMRAELRIFLPSLVAVETQEEKMGLKRKVGTEMNPEVSPLEAAFLAMLMMQQKMLNDDWQQTPQEWASNRRKKQLSHEDDANFNSSPQFGVKPEGEEKQRRNDEKRNEMLQLVMRGAARLSSSGIKDLAESSLDTLGIAKLKEGQQ